MSTEPKRGDNSTSTKTGELATREFLSCVKNSFDRKPFQAHRLFGGGHAQTLAAYAWPNRYRFKPTVDEERLFAVDPQTRVLAQCRWHTEPRQHPTMVMWHGMEGSTASGYMPSTAEKAFAAGFNVVRVNLRNCGGTEHLTPTLYHAGLSEDFRAVLNELIEHDRLTRVFAVGFSLSGNIVLKLAGEYGNNPPPQLLGVCAISPSVDHSASVASIMLRSNRIYQRDFLRRMRNRVRRKHKLYPHIYDVGPIDELRTLRDFDETYTSRIHGFADAEDYYQKTSCLRVIDRIRVPTLIVHAEDDPFIPFAPLRHPAIEHNPYLLLIATSQGGHVAFVSSNSKDRFWAEQRLVEFCELANETF